MALIEYQLDKKIDKVENALKIIRLGALSPEPLYVCYSGGKDSKVLRRLMEMSGVAHELHYNLTTVDIPSVVREILDDKEVTVDKARYPDGKQKTMWNLIVKKRIPPTRICRYCCAELKEASGTGRICVTGVRASESTRRAAQAAQAKIFGKEVALIHNMDNDESRRQIEQCYRTQKTLKKHEQKRVEDALRDITTRQNKTLDVISKIRDKAEKIITSGNVSAKEINALASAMFRVNEIEKGILFDQDGNTDNKGLQPIINIMDCSKDGEDDE